MILTCSYEELTALQYGARSWLDEGVSGSDRIPAVAVPGTRHAVEGLLARLGGYLSVRTLEEQEELEEGLRTVVHHLRSEVDSRVLAAHPADEYAVSAYFDFAHALSVLQRVIEMGAEMRALVELMSGGAPPDRAAREFVFPD